MADDGLWNSYFASKGVSEYDEKYWKFMSKHASIGENNIVLEAGCGSGRTLLNFKRSYVVGIDISAEALNLASKNLKGTDNAIIKADIRKLPFKTNVFDLVYNSGVLEHFKKPEDLQAISEMVRVTKKGCRVIVIVPNTLCLWYTAGKHIARLLGKWRFGYESSYTIWGLRDLFEKAGLKVELTWGLQLFPPSHDGFRRIYPQIFSKIFSWIEKKLGRLNKYFAYAVVSVGRNNQI